MIEATLMIDSYGRNLMYTDTTAMIHQIYNLIVMDPGTDDLNLEKGIGILSYYYEYNDDVVLIELQNKIMNQVRKYTPYNITNVICKGIKNSQGKYILHIFISLSNLTEIINVSTDGEKSELALITM